jgi:hypothetical protein
MAAVTISPAGGARVEISGAGMFRSYDEFPSAVSERQNLLLRLIANQPGTGRGSGPLNRQAA